MHTVTEKTGCLAEKVAEITCMTCPSTYQQTTGPRSASLRLFNMEIIGYFTPLPTFDGLGQGVIVVVVRVSGIVSSKHEGSNVAARDAVELRDIDDADARVGKSHSKARIMARASSG